MKIHFLNLEVINRSVFTISEDFSRPTELREKKELTGKLGRLRGFLLSCLSTISRKHLKWPLGAFEAIFQVVSY